MRKISMFLFLFCLSLELVLGGVNYPVITQELRDRIVETRHKGFVGSEGSTLEEGDFIAISLRDHWWKGDVFQLIFENVPGLPDYKYPVLVVIGEWIALTPRVENEFRRYDDGSKACYGYTDWAGETIFIYAWSHFDLTTGQENWTVNVTWGENAWVSDAGNQLDRTEFGTLPDEKPRFGFDIQSIDLVSGKPILKVIYDAQAWFWLETSSDLTTWERVSFYLDSIPGTEKWEGDVMSTAGVLKPLTLWRGNGKNRYYRLLNR